MIPEMDHAGRRRRQQVFRPPRNFAIIATGQLAWTGCVGNGPPRLKTSDSTLKTIPRSPTRFCERGIVSTRAAAMLAETGTITPGRFDRWSNVVTVFRDLRKRRSATRAARTSAPEIPFDEHRRSGRVGDGITREERLLPQWFDPRSLACRGIC